MDLKTFAVTISQIAEEKGISQERVIETVEMALAAAYKKEYGERGQIIRAKFNPETGEVKFWQVKIVVDESMLKPEEEGEGAEELTSIEAKEAQAREREQVPVRIEELKEPEEGATAEELVEKKIKFNPEKHIMIAEAKESNPNINLGEEVVFSLETKLEFGRIAAQTAKQVIIQRIREAEKESVFSEYKGKEGEIVSGIVQRVEGRNAFLDIGKTTGLLPYAEQIPGEIYRPGQRLKTFLLKVEETTKGPVVLLSRAYPKMLSKLFELEVPEIASGTVLIKAIAREPGSRSKIAVASTSPSIDPIGSCVGQKGTRVGAVIAELNGEKIDIIQWDEDPQKFIANALSPAKVVEAKIDKEYNQALVFVEENQLSLAIGREGQNVMLAARLTGWKIDIRPYRPSIETEEKKAETESEKELGSKEESKEKAEEAKDVKEKEQEKESEDKNEKKKEKKKGKTKNTEKNDGETAA